MLRCTSKHWINNLQPNISKIAKLIAEPARANMLLALMGGKALTATELSLEAGTTAQTASSHLAKLVSGDLLLVRKQGRHKYFQLHNYEVAQMLEGLLNMSANKKPIEVPTGPKDPSLRNARVCYDHLAGKIGVDLYNSLVSNNYLYDNKDTALLTDSGKQLFSAFGVNLQELEQKKRPLCKACLDWSERKSHLGGSLGKWVLDEILSNKWAEREPDSRVLRFCDTGLNQLKSKYKMA